jgi:hypothetical protein
MWRAETLTKSLLADLGPLYHNFSFFGVRNEQLPGPFAANQAAKAPVITAYIARSIAKSERIDDRGLSFMGMFCADGYYAMVASRLGCTTSVGVDDGRDRYFEYAEPIANRLGLTNVSFMRSTISPDSDFAQSDIVANVGGLYHVKDPVGVLSLSARLARQFLIVQNVVSLATDDADYFERPAPGWTWGNRFSRASFDRVIENLGLDVIDRHFNVLEGNARSEDRGSCYYLLERKH